MAKFGNFLSGRGAIFNPIPQNHEEAVQHGNALAYGKDSNYPVGTSDCFNVGISGGCGILCFVLALNRCKIPEECLPQIESGEYDSDIFNYEKTANELINKVVNKRLEYLRGKNASIHFL